MRGQVLICLGAMAPLVLSPGCGDSDDVQGETGAAASTGNHPDDGSDADGEAGAEAESNTPNAETGSTDDEDSEDTSASESSEADSGESDSEAETSSNSEDASSDDDASGDASDGGDSGGDGCGRYFDAGDAETERGYLVMRRSLEIAGIERNYLLSVPEDYDPDRAYPLVYGFHGSGGDREQLRRYMNVERPAESNAIFVYPEGLEVNGGATGWDLDGDSDDLAFVDALRDTLGEQLCIDSERIFATGHSFGGCMSNTVGCYRGAMFRAIAPIAGCGPFRNADCQGKVAPLLIHSPKDTATQYSGAIRGCTTWLRANNCEEMPECGCHWVDELGDAEACEQEAQTPYDTEVDIETSDRDDAEPILRSYLGCDEGYPVAFADHWRRERQDPDDPDERWHNPPPWSPGLIWEFFGQF